MMNHPGEMLCCENFKQFQVKEKSLKICGVVEAIRHVFGVSLINHRVASREL
jgi:hypothetical protein